MTLYDIKYSDPCVGRFTVNPSVTWCIVNIASGRILAVGGMTLMELIKDTLYANDDTYLIGKLTGPITVGDDV